MKKRLVSMILSAVLFATSVPVAAFAEDANTQNPVVHSEKGTSQGSNARKESGIDYKKNGGTFAEGYTAPSNYDEPVTELPGAEQITKAGYEFAGWYDNEEFNGEPVTSLSTADHSGSVVLYAKWTERYYYVDIPQTVNADGDKLTIKADAGGLYDKDHVSVTVQSENDWKLKSGLHSLAYELRNPQSGSALENGSVVASLTKDESHKQQEYNCNILDKPNYTGDYTDHLTFDIAFQDTAYNITYETNGGTITKKNPQQADQMITVTQEQYQAGTILKDLPAPVKKSSTFLGWCYDEACTRYVDSKDRLLSDVTLYASYADNQPMEEVSMATYARANDVAADFTIPVTDTSAAMTPDQVRKNFTIKNVTDSSETVTVDVTEGADHTFTISNPNGWTPGAAYKLELQEKALYFTGFDPTIRVYDFTVYREEVKNVELNKEIKYIHKKELSNLTVNGKKVEEVSIAAMTIGTDGSLTEEGSDTTGTFTYKKQLEVGDQVAIYSGDVIPTMDMSSGDNSDVSFIEITGADGDKYTYRGSRPEDVLFMPDVLPLSMDKDQDGDPDNNSVTINVSDLTFGDDAMSRAMDLDSETTVDEGDYLALYTGTMGENESGTVSLYGEITSVLLSEGKYIVSYIPVSEEDMRQTMDVYQKENVEGEDLLEDTDVQALEEDIETQAVDSGFASEVAERVADAAMETESFEELQESLKEDMNADIMVQSQGYGQLRKARAAGGAGGSRVELGVPTVKANLGTTLKHFDGDVSGLRLALEIGVPITVHVNRGADIEIMITATFEQEVRVSIDVDGSAVWKTWGFIPYIADYRVTASLELYAFAGWYTDAEFKKAFDGVVPARDITLYAKWDVQSVNYTVKHCLQNANDDGYSLGAQENFNADTDTVVTPEVKNFDGFTAPEKQQVTVEGDGRTTVIYRYTRNVHTLTLKNYDGKTDKTVEARYEMSIPKPTRAGYAFAGWYTDAKCTKEYKANMPDQNLTLYAKWEANIVNYVVEHYQQNVQGDGYTLKESSHARAAVDSEVTPEVMKYKGFEEPKTEKVTISGDGQTTVKYYYKRKVHTVTFDANSGTFAAEKGEDDSKIVVTGRYGANITVPKAPARTGYQFLGWDEDVEMTIPDKDLTYKAQWLKMEYTLQFKTGGGTTIEPIKGNYGDKINTPENPTRKGYIFKNWSKNGKKVDNLPTTMPAESHIYTAIWERETYQITYDLNGGSMKSGEKNPTTYNVDTTVFKLKNPVRAGYTFTGWSGTEITGVSDNVSVKQGSIEKREYKANWRENTYQITFILSGTEAKGSMAAKTVNYTENVTLPKCGFTCKGHSFKRWYTVDKKGKKTYYSDRQKVSKLTDVNGGVVTLYPEWEANVYNVTFDYGDGRAKTVRKTKYGDKYQFPSDPTRYGWEFKGWKKEGANTAFDMSTKELQLQDAKNITLYASWKANQKYSYRPSNSGNTYRVTDKHEYTRFTYYVDGNQTSVKTTGDSGLDPARYHLNMKNISYNAVHQNYSKMRIRISYKIKMVKDGYSDLRISYHTKSDNKDHTEWKKNTEDLKKKNGKTITCEYTLTTGSKIDVDSLTLEFDAHGVEPDRYDLSNLNVDITFE